MKKILILIIVIFIKINFIQAQNWAMNLSAKKQVIETPHRNGNGNFDSNTFYQIGVDKSFNKIFGLNASVAYLKLSDSNGLGSFGYYDSLTMSISNKISSNIFQIKISPFVYLKKNRNEISLRPSIGLGIVKTNQTIINELSQLKKQKNSIINDDYTYKTKFMPCVGISLNYNYYFLQNWSVGASIGIEQLAPKSTEYEIANTNESAISKYPDVAKRDIEELRTNEYRNFGNFQFIQIGVELKKRF